MQTENSQNKFRGPTAKNRLKLVKVGVQETLSKTTFKL
jgi:hypothetical protein